MKKPIPGRAAPGLRINVLGHGAVWSLEEQHPPTFTMLVFYRGLHSPQCRLYLESLDRWHTELDEIGVAPIALSTDSEAGALAATKDWGIPRVKVGYNLGEATARSWGLYLTRRTEGGQPEVFNEPALYLIQPDATVYLAAINSMPFGRPDLGEVIANLKERSALSRPPGGTYDMVPGREGPGSRSNPFDTHP